MQVGPVAVTLGLIAAGVAVFTLGQAEARQPGTVQNGINTAADAAEAGVGGGVRVVINGTQEVTRIIPQAPATTIVDGGESTAP